MELFNMHSRYWLVRPKDHLDGNPDNTDAPSSASSGINMLAAPKKFVPKDWALEKDILFGYEEAEEEESQTHP